MDDKLNNLLNKYGLLPSSQYVVARPHLSKEEHRDLAKIKKKYKRELTNAKDMRADVLNITRGVARPRIVDELLKEGHTEAAYLLTFNNDQIALLLSYKDYEQDKPGSSSKRKRPGSSSHSKPGSSSQGKASKSKAKQ
jgi:hypothetical protein